MYSNYSVSGEYVGTFESLDAAIKKLHPNAKLEIQQGITAYSIREHLKGHPVLLTIEITRGETAAVGDPCYDVYILGSSGNGSSKQLVDRLVAEAGINVMPESKMNNFKSGSTPLTLSQIVEQQIDGIMERERF